jgi:hypothetical protein
MGVVRGAVSGWIATMLRIVPTTMQRDVRPAYFWCQWCGEAWDGEGRRRSARHDEVWCDSDHNQRCEMGGRDVGVAWSKRERSKLQRQWAEWDSE